MKKLEKYNVASDKNKENLKTARKTTYFRKFKKNHKLLISLTNHKLLNSLINHKLLISLINHSLLNSLINHKLLNSLINHRLLNSLINVFWRSICCLFRVDQVVECFPNTLLKLLPNTISKTKWSKKSKENLNIKKCNFELRRRESS